MEKFELIIFRQSRTLIALLLFGLSLTGAVYLSTLIDSIVLKILIPVVGFGIINFCAIYAAYGKLTVVAIDRKLNFTWTKKLFFNYPPIADFHIKDIKKIVIDNNGRASEDDKESLKKIITKEKSITINSIRKKDSDAFIRYLKMHAYSDIVDSWDILREKGLLKPMYYTTNVILVAGAALPLWIIVNNGLGKLESHLWGFFIPSYMVMFRYWLIIKEKINKYWWQQKN